MHRPFEKIYVKDFDGNILNAPTVYYFEEKQPDGSWKEVEILAHDHDSNPNKYMDEEKYKFINNDRDSTYQNCRDYATDPRHPGPLGLIKDIEKALEQQSFAPSFEKFKNEVLVNAELFAIITARANGPDTLKRGMKRINELALTQEQKEQQIERIKKRFSREKYSDSAALDRYFDVNCYMPVNNVEFAKIFDMGSSMGSAQRKVKAMDRYQEYVMGIIPQHQKVDEYNKIKLGFSDDGIANIDHMAQHFANICHYRSKRPKPECPYDFMDYRLYYTSNRETNQLNDIIAAISRSYNNAQLYTEDQSYQNANGIWMPVTKVTIEPNNIVQFEK